MSVNRSAISVPTLNMLAALLAYGWNLRCWKTVKAAGCNNTGRQASRSEGGVSGGGGVDGARDGRVEALVGRRPSASSVAHQAKTDSADREKTRATTS